MRSAEGSREIDDENRVSLDEIIKKTGYEEVSTIEELELSPDQIKQAKDFINDEIPKRFFIAERPDRTQAKAIIAEGKNDFNAHIFSLFGYEGHTENNDFSPSELEANLINAKDRNENGNSINKQFN